MTTTRRRILVVTTLALLVLPAVTIGAAGADTAPPLTCGTQQPGPCSQTLHFTDNVEFLTPPPATPSSCPSFVAEEGALIQATGNGVEHVNVNKAQDSWFTSTFTGRGTATIYPLSSLVLDSEGNVTDITGPPDGLLPVFDVKITDWFGGSFNNKNSVFTGTTNISLSGDGLTFAVHVVFHANWNPGTDPNGPPTMEFDHITCS